jgi:hypothetical protein
LICLGLPSDPKMRRVGGCYRVGRAFAVVFTMRPTAGQMGRYQVVRQVEADLPRRTLFDWRRR